MTLAQILHVEDLFHHLGKEDERPQDRKIEVARNAKLEKLEQGLAEVHRIREHANQNVPYSSIALNELYMVCTGTTPESYTASEIETFVLTLHPIEGNLSASMGLTQGAYLSWLMNNSPDTSFTLQVKHLEGSLAVLGFKNDGKIIRTIGNGGHRCGCEMIGGKLRVEGDVGSCLGCDMRGGL